MLFVFALPPISAAFILQNIDKIKFMTNTEHGLIVNNPQIMRIHAANDLQNIRLLATAIEKNKWRVIYIRPQNCHLECQTAIQRLQKLHLALGAQKDRVAMYTTYSDLVQPQIMEQSIIILNPLDYYVMHYAADSNYSYLLQDLRRLLKYSHAN